jgi:hypothetical protein
VLVVQGALEVRPVEGFAWLTRGEPTPRLVGGIVTLTSGDGSSVARGNEVGYLATGEGPAEIWLINISEKGRLEPS